MLLVLSAVAPNLYSFATIRVYNIIEYAAIITSPELQMALNMKLTKLLKVIKINVSYEKLLRLIKSY